MKYGQRIDYAKYIATIFGLIVIICTGLYLKYELKPIEIVNRAELLSVEDVESQYNIQVLMPTGWELQYWCVRRGANIELDGIIGPNTIGAMDWIRCQQEASRHYPTFEDPNDIIPKEFWQ